MEEKFRLDDVTMALRVAKEFEDGMVVNLGIGIPTLTSEYVPDDREVVFHSENGVLGFGHILPAGEGQPTLVNASGQPVERVPGTCFMDHSESFAIVRGGFLDCSVLGGLQVAENGDLANWMVPEKRIGTIGGAMDLALGAKKVIVVMSHTTKEGGFKIVKRCTYPLTGGACVNLIVTDIAVIEVTAEGLVLNEFAPEWTPEEIQVVTEPELIIGPDCREITLV
jgi:3-oxoacid CoA-transferase B subunit